MYGDDFIYVIGAIFAALFALFMGLMTEVIFHDWAASMSVFSISFILGLMVFLGDHRNE